MMRVLMYDNRKEDPTFFDISTPEKEKCAYLRLFQYLDQTWEVYANLTEDTPAHRIQKRLYDKAKTGDATAARQLIHARYRYEYEGFSIVHVIDPTMD